MLELPPILMVFTGGTISMKIVPGRGAVPASGGREILEQVPRLSGLARITCEDFARLPGPHWTAERMLALSKLLDDRLGRGDFAGAVVTHGTDSLEETAYFLDLVLRSERPVVLTGAMRTADDPEWDGPQNLVDSVRAATSLSAMAPRVTVMFGGTLHEAREVHKSHTEAFAAFTSDDGGPLGRLEPSGLRLDREPSPREKIPIDRVEPAVDLVSAYLGADSRFLEHAIDRGARGIVLEAMGGGNVPPAMLPGVRRAGDAGVPVVVASRCGRGATGPRYGYDGGGVTLRDAGAMFAGGLSAPKARIKLMVLLGAGASRDAIETAFARREP